jgi:hypothetical protein
MSKGKDLSPQQLKHALAYNLAHHSFSFLTTIRGAVGLQVTDPVDDAFIRVVADWQEANIAVGAGDGVIGPRTEAHLNLVHRKAIFATRAAKKIQQGGFILFDSWGNDYRDNNLDGVVDGTKEYASDGAHMAGSFPAFGTVAGTYKSDGWDFLPPGPPVVVKNTGKVNGPFRYRVCADVVSAAYADAGIMKAKRSTLFILDEFKKKGFVWRRTDGYPTEYLPGDFICTLAGAEGHSGIVMQGGPTKGGATPPVVMQLPGPSTQMSDGTYSPERTNDVTIGAWSIWRTTRVHTDFQFLGRILRSKIGD